jgi:hypothetical protein
VSNAEAVADALVRDFQPFLVILSGGGPSSSSPTIASTRRSRWICPSRARGCMLSCVSPAALMAGAAGHSDFKTTQGYIDLAGETFRVEAELADERLFGAVGQKSGQA